VEQFGVLEERVVWTYSQNADSGPVTRLLLGLAPMLERISIVLNHLRRRRWACPGDLEFEGTEQVQSRWPGQARPRPG